MNNARNIAFWVVLLLLILALFNLFSGNQSTLSSRSLSYSDFIAMVDGDKVASVTLDGERVVREEKINVGERVRDVRQAPDGFIYIVTDSSNGKLMKLLPR